MKKLDTILFLLDLKETNKKIFSVSRKLFETKNIIVSSFPNSGVSKNKANLKSGISLKDEIYNSFWDLEFELFFKNYTNVDELVDDINTSKISAVITNCCLKNICVADLIKKLVRKTVASIFVYPNACNGIKSIDVGVDLSKRNHKDIDASYRIAKNLNIDAVNLINIYEVPLGYYKAGKTFEEFSKKLEDNIVSDFDHLIKKYSDKRFYFNKKIIESDNVSESIRNNVDKNSLLVIGDNGKNNFISMVLGNESEDIFFNNENPILLERNSSKKQGLLSSLLGLDQ